MRNFKMALCLGLVALASLSASASENKAQWLFVQTAADFTSDGNTVTIPYEREVFAFTDRPNRQYAYLNATELDALWNTGESNFGESPPNAVLTWLENGETREAEIILEAVKIEDQGRAITYQVQFEAGHELPAKAEQGVSLFIDQFISGDWACQNDPGFDFEDCLPPQDRSG